MSQNFVPVKASEEILEIEKYRSEILSTDSFGVIYTQEQILDYVKAGGYFEKLISNRPALPSGSIWTVGFLFKKELVNKVEKLSFSVVPIEYDTVNKTVKDRINGNIYHSHEHVGSNSSFIPEGEEDFANTGNIFP